MGIFYSQQAVAEPRSCDFYGTARYKGRNATSSDQLKAYDPDGQDCSGVTLIDNGNYTITVIGNDPSTTEDEGADESATITFKINGEQAGTGTFHNMDNVNLNLEVLDQPPSANPNGPYSGPEGSSIQFWSTNSVGTTFLWDFGDGSTRPDANPIHTYLNNRPNNAPYTASLTVYNNSGQSNTNSTTATISNVVPTVSASSDQPKNEGSVMNFTGSHTDPAGTLDEPYTYNWNFGDGSTANTQNTSHTYANHGVYTVILSVSDGDGGTGTKQISVTVNNVNPTAEAGSDQTVNEGVSVNFSGSATDPGIPGINGYGVKDVLTYSWNFGDGTTATGQNVSHTFPYTHAAQDQYTVTLTVNDGTGSGTDQLTVKVNNLPPTANPNGPYQGVVNQPVSFHGSATDPGPGDAFTYNWDLDGNGSFETNGQNPQKTYASIGRVNIFLQVTDAGGSTDTKNTYVDVNSGIRITLRTSPGNWQVKFDEQMHDSPVTFYVPLGSTHTINVPPIQGESGGTRYTFGAWSDGGAKEHVIVASVDADYTAQYNRQYLLAIEDGGIAGNPTGSGWYDQGAYANISIASEVVDQAGTTRYRFDSWEGTGVGAYNGSSWTVSVQMNGAITEKAKWAQREYRLRIESSLGTPIGAGWYSIGATARISVDAAVTSGSEMRSQFVRWVGEGSGSYTGTANPVNLTMNGPVVEYVEWNTQYFLDLVSAYGTPKGKGWYTAGTQVSVSVDTVVPVDADRRWRFSRWTGPAYTGSNPVFNVTMSRAITETVEWQQQYLVQVVSSKGNPKGGGWYASGATATFSIDSVASGGTGTRYRFIQWQGTGTGSYTGSDLSHSLVVQGKLKEEAVWKTQYFITMGIDPAGSGNVTPIASPGGWGTVLDTLNLKAMGSSEGGYGFWEWSGDTTSSSNPLKLILKKPRSLIARFKKGNVSLNTEPAGLFLKVDGVQVVSPAVFTWSPGERHRIGSIATQGDNVTTRYAFDSWSDSGALEHDITVPGSATTITARFSASYYLDVQSQYGAPVGKGWYTSGVSATVRIDTLADQGVGLRQKFTGWKGETKNSYTGSANPVVIKMVGPVIQRAEWKQQFRLNVTTFPSIAPGARIEIAPPGIWYDVSRSVSLKAVILDPTYSFNGWSGDASGTTNPLVVVLNSPKNIMANFKTPNPPPSIAHLPDTTLLEDQEMRLTFAWLGKFVKDANDPISSLVYALEGALHFSLGLDIPTQSVVIRPSKDWSGTEKIVVKVTDPLGQSDTDTMTIKVYPVQDSPSPFSLLSPIHNVMMVVLNYDDPLNFVWQRSIDPDPGDYVRYNFFLSPEPTPAAGGIQIANLADTSIYMMIQSSGVFYWGVTAMDTQGNRTSSGNVFKIDIRTGVEEESGAQPDTYGLLQNFPNPFNPATTIRYQLPAPQFVRLKVFDVQGRMVRVLVEGKMDVGEHQVQWDGKNEAGQSVPSGVYLLHIEAGKFIQQRRMTLVK